MERSLPLRFPLLVSREALFTSSGTVLPYFSSFHELVIGFRYRIDMACHDNAIVLSRTVFIERLSFFNNRVI